MERFPLSQYLSLKAWELVRTRSPASAGSLETFRLLPSSSRHYDLLQRQHNQPEASGGAATYGTCQQTSRHELRFPVRQEVKLTLRAWSSGRCNIAFRQHE